MAMSTGESEYSAVDVGERQWQAIKIMCADRNLTDERLCILKPDNKAALPMIDEPYGTKRGILIHLRHPFLAHHITNSGLKIMHMPVEWQNAYMFTNPCNGYCSSTKVKHCIQNSSALYGWPLRV